MVHQITQYLDWQLVAWISLFVFWLNYAMLPGSVFNPAKKITSVESPYEPRYKYPVQDFFNKRFNGYWLKPIFTCPVCMCSIWGTANYLTFSQHYSVISLCVTVIAAAGLTRLLKNFTQ